MKASEMTNEELAKELMSRVPLDSNRHDDLREAAARLRNVTVRTDNSGMIAELQRRLKVAEDALERIYQCVDNKRGIDEVLLVKRIIEDALAKASGESEARHA